MTDKKMGRVIGACLMSALLASVLVACKPEAQNAQVQSDTAFENKTPSAQLSDSPKKSSAQPKKNAQSLCNNQLIRQSYQQQRSDVQVLGCGQVKAVLADDNKGSRHQKFIVRLDGSSDTILIAHNIDLAPRVADLQKGDWVDFYGEYEFSDKGGVVHWTHRDPAGRHQHGYIDHQGTRYQ